MKKVRKTSERKMPSVSVSLDNGYVRRDGACVVYVITRLHGKKMKFHTGVAIKPEFFDTEKGLVRKSHPDSSDLNLLISSTRGRISDIFVRYRLQFEELTPDRLKREFKIASTIIDFHSFLDAAILERRGELTDSSMSQHQAMASKIKEFSPICSFSQLDADFMARFNRWMINKKKNGVNTRFNTFKSLKTYINIGIRKRIIKHNPLMEWMPVKSTRTERTFLSVEEVKKFIKIYDSKFLGDGHQKTLRHFLFMCFTGLRISDLRAVEMDQIVNGTLVFSAVKTKNRKKEFVKIPLPDIALRLIKDEAPHRVYGYIFHTFSEPQMRIKIKDVAEYAKLDKDISLHTGRHTFATMFLRKSKNLAVLQKLLGHSNIEQTMVYAHVLTEDIEEEMNKAFNDF